MATTILPSAQLSGRAQEPKDTVTREARPFTERAIWAAEGFRETEGEPDRGLGVARATRRIGVWPYWRERWPTRGFLWSRSEHARTLYTPASRVL